MWVSFGVVNVSLKLEFLDGFHTPLVFLVSIYDVKAHRQRGQRQPKRAKTTRLASFGL
jgi:hypothetical protein